MDATEGFRAPRKVMRFSSEWIDELIGQHAMDDEQLQHVAMIRASAGHMIEAILVSCPDSADRSAAIRHVRDAMMTANVSIALKGLV